MNKRDFLKVTAEGGGIIAASVMTRFVIAFVTQVILARILEPEVFGSLAFATTVAMFFNALTNFHGDKYVIYQKDCPQRAVNVAFTLELIAASFFLVFVFLIAPLIMRQLGKSDLTIYVQFMALAFLYNPFCRPRCLLERNLSFFRAKFPLIASQFVAAILAITLACYGFGIWSLLCWRLTVMVGEVLILWVIAPHKPRLAWDTDLVRGLLRFSWPLVGSAFLAFFYYNVDYFIIGLCLEDGKTQLGYYWLGFQAGSYFLISRHVLYEVLFPVFSRLDDEAFKALAFQRFTHAVGGIFLVLTMVAVFFGKDLVLLVYGSKWAPAIFPFQIIFITVLMRAMCSNIGYYLDSRGQTKPELMAALIFAILLPPLAYFATIHYGINGTAVSVLFVQVVVVVYLFERYIKPLTGKGTLHFFLWPWAMCGLTFLLSHYSELLELPLHIRLGAFAGILVVAYFAVLQSVLRDVKLGMSILRYQDSKD